MTKLLRIFPFLLCISAGAQTTNVSATLVDPAGTSWSNAKWTATVISSLNPPVTLPGYNSFTTSYSGVADANGTFAVTVQRVANIYPANSTWQFCVVSGITFPEQFCTNVPVGNAGQSTQDISAQINAVLKVPVVAGGTDINAYTDAEVVAVPGAQYYNVKMNAFRCYTTTWATCGGGGGANLPHVTQVISGDGTGNGVGMPEKGTNLVSNQAFVAWDEDNQSANGGMGRFDCRDAKYGPGGCLGANAAQAMQDVSDDMTCYQAISGKHASLFLPPGSISVGTPSVPTLTFPAGSYIRGAGGEGGAGVSSGTILVGHYNNKHVWDIGLTRTATCSDGNPHTSSLQGGSYERFATTGCAVGGCTNVPGDSGTYPEGGPLNIGAHIIDGHYWADQLAFYNTGADGVIYDGLDARIGTTIAVAHDYYFYYGIDVSGQNYVFSGSERHAGINLICGDCTFFGPAETYGTFMTLGVEYGHIFGVVWGGGTTYLGPVFAQIEEVGIDRPFGSVGGRMYGARIDGTRGDGIFAFSTADTYNSPTITSPCIANPANTYYVSAAAILTPGSGQTDGTYLLNASSGAAQISVVVSGGIATGATVVTNGRGYTSTPPTFTLAAGGTPGTFTITMQNVFISTLLRPSPGCAGIYESGGGGDTFVTPLVTEAQAVFGVSHATADYYTPSGYATWIAPRGNGSASGAPVWGQEPSEVVGQLQKMVLPDQIQSGGGTTATGSTIDLRATGTHVKLANTGATTISAFNNAFMMQDIWLFGDGFTTVPTSIADNCSAHDQLLNAGQWYHYFVSGGEFFSAPHLTEQCDPPNDDYRLTGFAALTSLPAINTIATASTAGDVSVIHYPALPNGTITYTGSTGAYSYCFIRKVWAGGGIQTDTPQCTAKTPPATTTPSDNLNYHGSIPLNWTEYAVILQSSTDPAYSSLLGTIVDVTSPTGLPRAAIADVALNLTTASFSGDAVTVPTASQGLNMTGTYTYDLSVAPPTVSSTYCIPGQFILNSPSSPTGYDYLCDSTNHWVERAANAWGWGGGGAGISLTTTGTSGVATLTGTVLNIPDYSSGGGGIPSGTAGQMLAYPTAGTTVAPQGQIYYSQSGDTIASIESECSSLCTYIVTTPQTFTLAANHALASTVQVRFQAGGEWTVNGAFTLTIPGNVSGTLNQHFAGSSIIQFGTLQAHAPVEWFGGVNDGTWNGTTLAGTDNTTALQACLNAESGVGQCDIQNGIYRVSSALSISTSVTGIHGNGQVTTNTGLYPNPSASIIMTSSASADIIDTAGVSVTDTIAFNRFDHFTLARALTPTGTATGLSVNYSYGLQLNSVTVEDSVRGLYLQATGSQGSGYIENFVAQVGYNGFVESSGNYYGIYADSTTGNTNPSLRIRHSFFASKLGATPVTYGFYSTGGAMRDLMMWNFETAGASYGEYFTYSSGGAFGASDIHLYGTINDSFKVSGMYFNALPASGTAAVEVSGGESTSTTSTGNAIDIESSQGITIHDHQIWASPSKFIFATGSTFLNISNNRLIGFTGCGICLVTTTDSVVHGNTIQGSSGTTGISITATSVNNTISANQLGGIFTTGITLDGTSAGNTGLETNTYTGTYTTSLSNGGDNPLIVKSLGVPSGQGDLWLYDTCTTGCNQLFIQNPSAAGAATITVANDGGTLGGLYAGGSTNSTTAYRNNMWFYNSNASGQINLRATTVNLYPTNTGTPTYPGLGVNSTQILTSTSQTSAASNCNAGGTLAGVVGCLTVNISGTAHYVPYF